MKSSITLICLGLSLSLSAQKKVITIPFEFEKSMLAVRDYDAYFLDNKSSNTISLILKDNRKVKYLQLDRNFKITGEIQKDLKSTVFSENITDYRGGTAGDGVFHFIYEEMEKKAFSKPVTVFEKETVNYSTGTISHDKLFEIPKAEKTLSSFSDHNRFITITADDKKKELAFYVVDHNGNFKEHRLPFTVPEAASKKRNSLSEYFANLQVIKTSEEPDFSAAVSSAKLFSMAGKLSFVINEADHPIHLFQIDLPDFKSKESFVNINPKDLTSDEKEKLFVNSFIREESLFSIIVSKKNIRIITQDVNTGTITGKQEINEESGFNLFAKPPVVETRRGKKTEEKDLDNIKKLLKNFNKGTEGIMVMENEKKQLVIMAGTYDLIPISYGGSSGGWVGGFQQSSVAVTPGITNHGATRSAVMVYNPNMYYRPGLPSYTKTSALYYNTTYFKILTDSTGSKIEKGKIPLTNAEQIKDYLQGTNSKATATNQFSLDGKEYYGYYDKESKTYIVEEIKLRKG